MNVNGLVDARVLKVVVQINGIGGSENGNNIRNDWDGSRIGFLGPVTVV
jgi:hypothetical protein